MLALLAAFLIQESPAELLKKVEEKYAAATSFSVSMDGTRTVQGATTFGQDSWSGHFKSKGDLARAECIGANGGKDLVKTVWVTDGTTMSFWKDKTVPPKKPALEGIGPWARRYHVRAGIVTFMASAQAGIYAAKAVKFPALFTVTSVADLGKEKVNGVECRVISATLAPPDKTQPPEKVNLWIDTANLVVLQRESVGKKGKTNVVTRETFRNPVFNAEIKDEEFAIPEK